MKSLRNSRNFCVSEKWNRWVILVIRIFSLRCYSWVIGREDGWPAQGPPVVISPDMPIAQPTLSLFSGIFVLQGDHRPSRGEWIPTLIIPIMDWYAALKTTPNLTFLSEDDEPTNKMSYFLQHQTKRDAAQKSIRIATTVNFLQYWMTVYSSIISIFNWSSRLHESFSRSNKKLSEFMVILCSRFQ